MITNKDFNVIEISKDTISDVGIIMSYGKWLCVIEVYLLNKDINKIEIHINDLTKKRKYFARNSSGLATSKYSDYKNAMKIFTGDITGSTDEITQEIKIIQELMKVCEYFDKSFNYKDFLVDNSDEFAL